MSDLFVGGGIGAVLRELKPMLHLDCMTVTGETLGERLSHEPTWVDRDIVRPLGDPYQKDGGLVALFGSLAPVEPSSSVRRLIRACSSVRGAP
jgi:dihydroxy-acid dehydratase